MRLMGSDKFVQNQDLVKAHADEWVKIFGILGYCGSRKGKIYNGFDESFGKDNWFPAHFFFDRMVSREEGYFHYEDGYYQFLRDNPDVRQWIVNTASEVYDIAPSNVESGLDYTAQECGATHLQDISIRRALTRLSLEEKGMCYQGRELPKISIFFGDHLIQVRGHLTEGFVLNPGQVPSHIPEQAIGPYKPNWWKEGSCEDIYQRNKVLVVNPESLELKLAMIISDNVFLEQSKRAYFKLGDEATHLIFEKGKAVRRQAHGLKWEGCVEVLDSPMQPFKDYKSLLNRMRSGFSHKKKKIFYDALMEKIK